MSKLHYDTVGIHTTMSKHTFEIQSWDFLLIAHDFFTNLADPLNDTFHYHLCNDCGPNAAM